MTDKQIIYTQREMIEKLREERENSDKLVFDTMEENRHLHHIIEVLGMSLTIVVLVIILR